MVSRRDRSDHEHASTDADADADGKKRETLRRHGKQQDSNNNGSMSSSSATAATTKVPTSEAAKGQQVPWATSSTTTAASMGNLIYPAHGRDVSTRARGGGRGGGRLGRRQRRDGKSTKQTKDDCGQSHRSSGGAGGPRSSDQGECHRSVSGSKRALTGESSGSVRARRGPATTNRASARNAPPLSKAKFHNDDLGRTSNRIILERRGGGSVKTNAVTRTQQSHRRAGLSTSHRADSPLRCSRSDNKQQERETQHYSRRQERANHGTSYRAPTPATALARSKASAAPAAAAEDDEQEQQQQQQSPLESSSSLASISIRRSLNKAPAMPSGGGRRILPAVASKFARANAAEAATAAAAPTQSAPQPQPLDRAKSHAEQGNAIRIADSQRNSSPTSTTPTTLSNSLTLNSQLHLSFVSQACRKQLQISNLNYHPHPHLHLISNNNKNQHNLKKQIHPRTSAESLSFRSLSLSSHESSPSSASSQVNINNNSNISSKQENNNSIKIMADQAVIDKLEAGFAKLQAPTPEQCHSLLKKYLTRDVLDKLKSKKTAMGATLLDVAQSGFENLDSGVGIYAPDAESYTLFSDLFNPIIQDYHGGFKPTDKHPASDFGDLNTLVNVDPENKFVISTRVRCGRSLQGYPFNPCLTEQQYKDMETKVTSAFKEMEGDLAGTYYPLTGMTKETQQQLIDDHFLFKEGDRFLQAANACRYWPTGRGIYHNSAKTFLVWVNEEDHLRIISMQKGGDLKEVFGRLVQGARAIEAKVPFSRDDRLGFLTFCPTNLGTTIRASVHIKLPKLAADRKKLEEVAGKYNLQVRGTSGEHTESIGGVYDISNKRRLGLTEYQAVREMQDGILELIKIEKSL